MVAAMPESAIDVQRLSFLRWLDAQEQERQAKYRQSRDYYNGAHDTQLTDRQRRFLEIKAGQEFNYNLCPVVVDALAEKLQVTGIDCEDGSELLWDWWQRNRMDGTQSVVHLSAVRDGDTYLMVEWDNEQRRPVFSHQLAYDGEQGCHVIYQSADRRMPLAAVKYWWVEEDGAGKYRRANIYHPDRIEKFVARVGGEWQEYHLTGEEWPAPWVAKDGTPLGIPVIHFRNREQGYSYGESELEDPIPLQNALNKSMIDLIAAADSTAFRILWMTGGDPTGISVAPGSWVYSTNADAKCGALDGADLGPMIALKDSVALDIARQTRTPVSYFQMSGQVAAEGTLKQQEAGLIAKVRNRMVGMGNSWEDAFYLARRLHNTFGSGGMDETQPITCVWADPESRNEKEHLDGLKIKAELGVPQETIWVEMGYDAAAIERMYEQKAREQAGQVQGIGQALMEQQRLFDQGGI